MNARLRCCLKRWKLVLFIAFSACELAFAVHRYPQLLGLRQDIKEYRKLKREAALGKLPPVGPLSFSEESTAAWDFKADPAFGLSRWSGGRWSAPGFTKPIDLAQEFLRRHSQELLMVDAASLQLRREYSEAGVRVVELEQLVGGVPVLSSYVRLSIDESINLINLESKLYVGSTHDISPVLPLLKASEHALVAVKEHAAHAGGDSSSYTVNGIMSLGEYVIVAEEGGLVNMYRFVVPMLAPLSGYLELLVNANSGSIDSIKNIATIPSQ